MALRHTLWLVTACVVMAAVVIGFGVSTDRPDSERRPSSTSSVVVTEPPATTSSTAPEPTPETPDRPFQVLLAGDSLMATVEPALDAAIGDGGGEATFLLSPVVPRGAPTDPVWARHLVAQPHVVVVLVGGWELDQPDWDPTAPEWPGYFRNEVLPPFIDQVTSSGAEVVWLGMPAVADRGRTLSFAALNEQIEAVATEHPEQMTYIDTNDVLTRGDGGYVEIEVADDGRAARLRRLDGAHLCPAGVVRVVQAVLDEITAGWAVPVAEGWESGSWRDPSELHRPSECPAPP